MSKELKKQLKELKKYHGQINPDASWVSSNRANLLSQISNTVDKEISHSTFTQKFDEMFNVFAPQRLMQVSRPFIVAFLAVGMTVGGWVAGADATYKALPGDTMYGVKIVAEKTKVALATAAGDEEVVIQLHLENAETRSKEVKKMVQKKTPESSILAGETMDKLKDSIETAKEQVKTIGETDNAKAVVLAKDIGKKTAEISKTLQEVAEIAKEDLENPKELPEATIDENIEVSEKEVQEKKEVKEEEQAIKKKIVEEVAETKKVVNQTGLEVLQRVVEKTIQNDDDSISETDKKDIVELVQEKIIVLSEEVKEVQKEAQENLDILKLSKDAQAVELQETTTTSSTTSDVIQKSEQEEVQKDEPSEEPEEVLEEEITVEGPKEEGVALEETLEVEDEPVIDEQEQEDREQIQKVIQEVEEVHDNSSKVDTLIEEVVEMDTLEQLLKAIEKTQEANDAHDEVIKKVEESKEELEELVQEIQVEILEERISVEVEEEQTKQEQREVVEEDALEERTEEKVEDTTEERPTE